MPLGDDTISPDIDLTEEQCPSGGTNMKVPTEEQEYEEDDGEELISESLRLLLGVSAYVTTCQNLIDVSILRHQLESFIKL